MDGASCSRRLATAFFVLVGLLGSAPPASGATHAAGSTAGRAPARVQGAAAPTVATPFEPTMPVGFRHDSLSRSRATAAIQIPGTWGGVFTTTSGERIQILASPNYRVDMEWLQNWANWMSTYLFHNQEFSKLTLLFVVPFELSTICGQGAGGCYSPSAGLIVAPGNNLPSGTNMATVLAHEYGHHIAGNASNPPWTAIDWGPKRWATIANVCGRVNAGSAFPGDEGAHYQLNPGEAFAETYRLAVYNSRTWTNGWWNPAPWNVVDPSFFPSSAGLSAATEDSLHPWSAAPSPQTSIRGKFRRTRRQVTAEISTPFDGDVAVTLYRPVGASLTLIDSGSGAVLATNTSSFTFRVCGQRSFRLRVTGRAGQSYRVDVTTP